VARNPGCERLSKLDSGVQVADNPEHPAMDWPDTRRVSYYDRYGIKPNSGGTSTDPEVPPDNNQAERSLRLAVTKRKVGGGHGRCRGLLRLLT